MCDCQKRLDDRVVLTSTHNPLFDQIFEKNIMVTPENTLSFDFMKVGVTGLNCIDMLA